MVHHTIVFLIIQLLEVPRIEEVCLFTLSLREKIKKKQNTGKEESKGKGNKRERKKNEKGNGKEEE